MLLRMHSILGRSVLARDGNNGRVEDFLLDDQTWSLRFLMSDIGGWLRHNQVLIPTLLLGSNTVKGGSVSVELTGAEMQHCFRANDADTLAGRYHFVFEHTTCPQYFWSSTPAGVVPPAPPMDLQKMMADAADGSTLRSVRDLLGFDVVGIDGETIAAVDDFEVDSVSWTVRKVVMRRGVWPFSRWAAIGPVCVEGVSWVRKSIRFDGTRGSLHWLARNQAFARPIPIG